MSSPASCHLSEKTGTVRVTIDGRSITRTSCCQEKRARQEETISPLGNGTRPLASHDKAARDYSLELVGKTIDILEALRRQGELRLTDIVETTLLDKSTIFRILYTLEQRGYVLRDLRTKKFRLPLGHRKFRVGYAQPWRATASGTLSLRAWSRKPRPSASSCWWWTIAGTRTKR